MLRESFENRGNPALGRGLPEPVTNDFLSADQPKEAVMAAGRTRLGDREKGKADSRFSLSNLLLQDFRPADDSLESGAAAERLRSLVPMPGFLLVVHIVCVAALLAALFPLHGNLAGLFVALFATLSIDFSLWLVFKQKPLARLMPHLVVRGAALYVILSGMLWAWIAHLALAQANDTSSILSLALLSGFLAVPVALLSFPGLVAIGSFTALFVLAFIANDTRTTLLGSALALCLLRLSLVRFKDRLAQIKRRLQLDWAAQRASRFVQEFEQGGRGWFWETTVRGAISYVSDQLAADLQTPASALIGRQFTDLIGSDDRRTGETERTLGFHLSARLPFTDINVRASADSEIWWSLSGSPSFDEHGRFLGFRGIGTDLTQQRRSEEEINRLARYDSLTGLPNRMMMRRTLEEALQNKRSGPAGCALFLIDLDRFKNVNDTLGHPVGDSLLKHVAQRLTSVIGERGQIGRLGGDEFEAVLPGLDDQGSLSQLASRLIQQVSMPYTIDGHHIQIGASVGIAIVPPEGCGVDPLVRNADLALYSAKAAGRGTFCFFAPEMHEEAQDRQTLENDLRQAIGNGELRLVYQPVVNAKSEELSGFEALVRWMHPTRGLISPTVFIPLAEESGLILQLGEWVLRTACQEAASWPENIRVAVNLSPIQFTEPNLPQLIVSALATSQLAPRRLELEITEGVFLVESESTDDMFARLKQIGVRLALDDFGTGYSSLGYLKKAPFDKIKIDQSFVRGAATMGSRNAAIIRAIVSLAESLGMDTTAEGAETHDELTLIRELGCSHIQGYIFGRPMEAEDARGLAAEHKKVSADGFQFNRPPRQGLLKLANVQWNGMQFQVRVRNISAGGAMVEGDRILPTGASVQLDLPEAGSIGAEVRWAEARRMGLQFDEAFDIRKLNAVKPRDTGDYRAEYLRGQQPDDRRPLRATGNPRY
jgi:diguanylate cyclase (GGDEF)-like protein